MKKIVIYSSTNCSFCHALKSWLKEKNIAFEDKVVDTDPKLTEEFMSVSDGFLGTPFTIITAEDGTVTKIAGFDRPKFEQVLAA